MPQGRTPNLCHCTMGLTLFTITYQLITMSLPAKTKEVFETYMNEMTRGLDIEDKIFIRTKLPQMSLRFYKEV